MWPIIASTGIYLLQEPPKSDYDKTPTYENALVPLSLLMKACRKCCEVKRLQDFYDCKTTRDGKFVDCKECIKARKKERYQIPEVKAKIKTKAKKQAQTPEAKAHQKTYREKYRQTPEAKAYQKTYREKYRQTPEAKARRREWEREKYHNDPLFRFTKNMRRRINLGLKGYSKSETTEQILGCTFEEAWKIDLIPKFRFPMTRENYGEIWEVDHIRPVSSFDLSDPEQVKACFHHSNLQPLFIEENRSKSGKY